MPGLGEVLAAASLREESVEICMAGQLNARWEDLGRQLAAVLERTAGENPDPAAKLSDADPRAELTAEMEEVRQQMVAASYKFRFRALPRRQYRDLIDKHPGRPERREVRYNEATFPPALIRQCMIDPAIGSDAEFRELADVLTDGQTAEMFNAAYLANEGGSEVPKSVPGFAATPRTG